MLTGVVFGGAEASELQNPRAPERFSSPVSPIETPGNNCSSEFFIADAPAFSIGLADSAPVLAPLARSTFSRTSMNSVFLIDA